MTRATHGTHSALTCCPQAAATDGKRGCGAAILRSAVKRVSATVALRAAARGRVGNGSPERRGSRTGVVAGGGAGGGGGTDCGGVSSGPPSSRDRSRPQSGGSPSGRGATSNSDGFSSRPSTDRSRKYLDMHVDVTATTDYNSRTCNIGNNATLTHDPVSGAPPTRIRRMSTGLTSQITTFAATYGAQQRRGSRRCSCFTQLQQGGTVKRCAYLEGSSVGCQRRTAAPRSGAMSRMRGRKPGQVQPQQQQPLQQQPPDPDPENSNSNSNSNYSPVRRPSFSESPQSLDMDDGAATAGTSMKLEEVRASQSPSHAASPR